MSQHLFQTFCWCLALFLLMNAGLRASDLSMLDGSKSKSELVHIDEDWSIKFSVGDEQRQFAVDEIDRWGELRGREDTQQVVLADGGVLNVSSITVSRAAVTIASRVWRETSIPREFVRGVIFRPPADRKTRDKLLFAISDAAGINDRLLLENGDRLDGRLLDEAEESAYQLETQRGPVAIPRDKVVAMTYNPTFVEKPVLRGFHCRVGFKDGSRLNVSKFVPQEKKLDVKLAIGVDLKFKPFLRPSPWAQVTMLRPVSPKVTYLSDLPDLGYRHVPFLKMEWKLAKDRNVGGGMMRAEDQTFEKGVGMHSASRVFYQLDGKFRRFEAKLAIDQSAGSRGSVTCQVVLVDQDGKLKSALKSAILRGGQKPIPISIDVTGAKRLALVVGFADHGDTWDHLNWLDARLIK